MAKANRETFNNGFWAGAFGMLLFEMARQDLLGKERYLASIQANWVDGWRAALGYVILGGGFLLLIVRQAWNEYSGWTGEG